MKNLLKKWGVLIIALLVMFSGVAAAPVQANGFSGTAAIQASECGDTYVVRTGDTLRKIATECGVTIDEILELNDFIENRNLIYAGWVLDLPVEDDGEEDPEVVIPDTGAATISSTFYIVKAGDTLTYISRRLDFSQEELLTVNPQLSEEQELFTGQILLLPYADDVPAAAVSPRVVEPGQHVTIVASGFEGGSEVFVAGGPLGDDSRVFETFQVNDDGFLRKQVTIPMEAERGNRWTFVVQEAQAEVEEDTADDDQVEPLRARTNLVYIVDTGGPNDSIEYNVRLNDTLSAIAANFGVEIDEILKANPHIDSASVIYVGQDILIPGPDEQEDNDEDDTEEEQTVVIPETGASTVSSTFYIVKAGDTLSYIARRLDLGVDEILTANPQLSDEPDLFTGQILLLPYASDEPAAAVSPRVVEPGQLVTIVARGFEQDSEVVVAGGPLGEESRVLDTFQVNGDGMLRTSIRLPMEAERGNRWIFVVQPAQPEDDDTDTPSVLTRTNLLYVVDTTGPEESIVYNVRVNDTLSAIAVRFGVEIEDLLEANPQIESASIINVGQDILIPGAAEREEPEN